MRIYSYLVTKNEAGRYLKRALTSILDWTDGLVVYDDQSTDDTLEVVSDIGGISTIVRPDDVPSFLENEGKFREAAWRAMEEVLEPQDGDWILTLDADEFLIANLADLRNELATATERGIQALWCHVHECWAVDGEDLMVRTDGYWGSITALRACVWQPDGDFADRTMGGGSVPSYARHVATAKSFEILHLGYLRQEDREAKYQRYRQKPGHNPRHIESILKRPMLDFLGNATKIGQK